MNLWQNKLAWELCEGPWLDSLEELSLSCNSFAQLPSALLLCKGKLRKLNISCNRISGEDLSDQAKELYQELVAAGTEVRVGSQMCPGLGASKSAHEILEASL